MNGRQRVATGPPARLLGLLAGALLGVTLACAPAPPRPLLRPLEPAVSAFLLSPETGLPAGRLEAATIAELQGAHRRLLAGDTAGAVAVAERLRLGPETADAAAVLLAGTELAKGATAAVIARLAPVVASDPGYLAALLPLARAHELNGDERAAFERYAAAANAVPVAAERARALLPAAAAAVHSLLATALGSGDLEGAGLQVAWLERWLPEQRTTIEARRRLSSLRGDSEGELRALRRLVSFEPESRELLWRQGELELEVGDASRGLALFEGLARRYPADPEVTKGGARARFLWRLTTLPPRVQQLVRHEVPTRGDFAALLYWLVPGVRAGRPSAARVATDVLDHPWREEIVRVANFGVMRVDETRHLFEPDRALTRGDAHLAFARLLLLFGRRAPCLHGIGLEAAPRSSDEACALLAACGIVDDPELCRESGPASNRELLEQLRRVLERFDGGPG
ncbi:MAG: S-layer homology domain-containing protein [Acidobacteria bacterium]|nr:S-layer homology domain-containing protein [Thermoanaerobaculia bacterium]NLN11359.1 S-layer homology domain-containing protein [Acidobacteriota bacterium]MBP7813868.1 S-layer homology domain-containing protein [Thermoanaerobaculia bacterium]MBP8844741.1 S-layer homology domain-containing protein [Thermoanaerobaculia bacterium]HPA94931.1 hypothetical protein [Thermoanaerobaculia bacterium]